MVDLTSALSQAGEHELRDDRAVRGLIIEAKQHSHAAFEELYYMFVKDMNRYISYRVPAEVASDILSDIFLRVWRKLPNFQGDSEAAFRSWMYTIAHHLVVDYYRAKKETYSLEAAFDVATEEDFDDPIAQTQQEFLKDHVVDLVKQLSLKDQEIITLRFFHDFSHQEIAEILGIKEGNVRIILHRALKKLKQKIEK